MTVATTEFSLVDLLQCPSCHGSLDTVPASADLSECRWLRCTSCGSRYEVRGGIPRFVSEDHYAQSFGLQWNRFKSEQIDSVNGLNLSERRFLSETAWDPGWLEDKIVIDVGCGAGRFLDVARKYARAVVGVDVSIAVEAARMNVGDSGNVHLIQADIFQLPFRDGVFDACYCIGVLQHTPAPGAAVAELGRVVGAGGSVAVTVYERRRWTRYHSKYLARRLTTRLPPQLLLRFLRVIMPVAFLVTEALFRVPRLGRLFAFAIPVANYVDEPELSLRQRYRWALLDTFDMLSPAYDRPIRQSELRAALAAAGMSAKRLTTSGLTLVGSKSGV